MRSAGPPTEDDVTVLFDGRRLNSRESVEAWLIEVEAIRALEAATRDVVLIADHHSISIDCSRYSRETTSTSWSAADRQRDSWGQRV